MTTEPPSHDATQAIPAFRPAPPPPEPAGAAPPPPEPAGAASPAPGLDGAVHPGQPPAPTPWGQPSVAPGAAVPAGAASAPGAPPRRTGRVVARALVVLLVVGALAGTTAWGFVNRASAERWRDRAEADEADLRAALDRVEETEDDLAAATERLRDVANESASESDRNRILQELVAQAPEVTAALADCQTLTAMLANDLIDALDDPEPDLASLQGRTDRVNATCADALRQARDLQSQIDALGI